MIENFKLQPETRWRFFTDDVMGGVSTGQVTFLKEGNQTYAHMTGNVSTENNGGFIQAALALALLNDTSTVPDLVELLVQSDNDATKSFVALSLAFMGDPAVTKKVGQGLHHDGYRLLPGVDLRQQLLLVLVWVCLEQLFDSVCVADSLL